MKNPCGIFVVAKTMVEKIRLGIHLDFHSRPCATPNLQGEKTFPARWIFSTPSRPEVEKINQRWKITPGEVGFCPPPGQFC